MSGLAVSIKQKSDVMPQLWKESDCSPFLKTFLLRSRLVLSVLNFVYSIRNIVRQDLYEVECSISESGKIYLEQSWRLWMNLKASFIPLAS